MSDQDSRWLKSTANELNNLLQVISESSRFLAAMCEDNADSHKYLDMLRTGVDRAINITRVMLQRAEEGSAPSNIVPVFDHQRPLHQPAPAVSPAAGDVKIENPNGSRELIMVVDDEEFVRVLAQRVLTDEDYRVITAKDGLECLSIYKKLGNEVDLIILDFTMPIMDGADVFTELRLINPQVPVMLSSGFTEQQKLRWMLAKGLRGFIPKPYTQQKLLLQLRSTLDALKSETAV
jgi:CheY-like chemotaxis protein